MTVTFSDAEANALMTALGTAGLFISLHSADPGKTGASELSGDGYARQASAWGTAANQAIANNGVVTFGPATADWTAAAYVGLWSLVSGGTFKAGAALDAPITVPNLGTASFAIGDLIFSLIALS